MTKHIKAKDSYLPLFAKRMRKKAKKAKKAETANTETILGATKTVQKAQA